MRKTWVVLGAVAAWVVVPFVCGADVEASFSVSGDVAASAAAGLADAHIGGLLDMMGILASTADLQVGVWGGMRGLLGRFEGLPISFNAWYLLPDGSYYKVESGLTGKNLSDRAYFPRVMAGETTLGDLVVSKSTGRKSMVMTVPIERSGTIIGALGVTVYLDDLTELLLAALALPDGVILFAYDGSGRMAVHSDTNLLLADVSESGVDTAMSASAVSSVLGWTFVVGASGN